LRHALAAESGVGVALPVVAVVEGHVLSAAFARLDGGGALAGNSFARKVARTADVERRVLGQPTAASSVRHTISTSLDRCPSAHAVGIHPAERRVACTAAYTTTATTRTHGIPNATCHYEPGTSSWTETVMRRGNRWRRAVS
jgi:hypothetical protein